MSLWLAHEPVLLLDDDGGPPLPSERLARARSRAEAESDDDAEVGTEAGMGAGAVAVGLGVAAIGTIWTTDRPLRTLAILSASRDLGDLLAPREANEGAGVVKASTKAAESREVIDWVAMCARKARWEVSSGMEGEGVVTGEMGLDTVGE